MKKINTLFLVDDDSVFQYLTRKLLLKTAMVKHIKIFNNGQEAIDFLKAVQGKKEEIPEIILLDLSMPVMDGWEFLEEYLMLQPRLEKRITIYIISSSINPRDIERAKKINAVTDFIIKPVTREKFSEIISKL